MPPEKRKRQLLKAGVAQFAQKGIGGTKHADLSRACEVSVPTIFTYFPNRESLVNSILDEVGEAVLDNVIVRAKEFPRSEQLAATASLYVEFAEREPDYVKVWLMWSMHFSPEVQPRFRRVEAKLIDALAEMIEEGASTNDPEEDIRDRARVIIASSAFLAKMVFDGVSAKRRNEFVDHILAPLRHAL